jgi:hypothetical protein
MYRLPGILAASMVLGLSMALLVAQDRAPLRTVKNGILDEVQLLAPLAATIAAEARTLRAEGASVIVVAAHAGGRCTDSTRRPISRRARRHRKFSKLPDS